MSAKQNPETLTYRDLSQEQIDLMARMIAKDNLPNVNECYTEIKVPDTFYTRYGKRMLDIIISFVALIVCSPLILIVLVITYFDVGRPILFKQTRIGKDGKEFTLIKPRNMTNECNDKGMLLPAPERITKWGHFARKTSLDELLNFWSILKGDMSIIGPRPLLHRHYERLSLRHSARIKVKPGLDCPLHDPEMGAMTWNNRFENDVWYVENVSFKTDVKLFMLMFRDVFWNKDRHKRGEGDIDGDFMGYTEDGEVMTSNNVPKKYYEALKHIETP